MFKVPKKTSVWKINQGSPAGILTFATELIAFIKDKRKYRTYRFADVKYKALKIGDIVTIKQNHVEKPIARAMITKKKEVLFKDLPLSTPYAHEAYQSKEHQRKVLGGYYAFLGREIKDDDKFFVIDFELID